MVRNFPEVYGALFLVGLKKNPLTHFPQDFHAKDQKNSADELLEARAGSKTERRLAQDTDLVWLGLFLWMCGI